MAKQKYYVVWEGHMPGVFTSWDAAKRQIDGFPQAKYKSFSSRDEAEKAFRGSYWAYVGKDTKTVKKSLGELEKVGVPADSLAVDAACSGNPGDMEYRGVHIRTGQEIFRIGPLPDGTNNIGEFLAIVHGLAWLKQQNSPNTPIYTDSRNAMLWIKAKTCRTRLARTGRNDQIFELIDRAEKWLAGNKVTNPIRKWETEAWGEIPADFGRK
ncbi:MAG: ribonuclease H family protein [Saprospiraceae bacterium]|nr:ribonuclease H family protein [Saprospiraceae bacterium]